MFVRVGIAAIFVVFAAGKFDGRPASEWVRIFGRIGFGQWFRVATGLIEIVGAILFVAPMTMRLGAGLLVATMVGAIIAHLTVLHDPFTSFIPLVLAAAVVASALKPPSYELQDIAFRRRDSRTGSG